MTDANILVALQNEIDMRKAALRECVQKGNRLLESLDAGRPDAAPMHPYARQLAFAIKRAKELL